MPKGANTVMHDQRATSDLVAVPIQRTATRRHVIVIVLTSRSAMTFGCLWSAAWTYRQAYAPTTCLDRSWPWDRPSGPRPNSALLSGIGKQQPAVRADDAVNLALSMDARSAAELGHDSRAFAMPYLPLQMTQARQTDRYGCQTPWFRDDFEFR